MSLKKKIFYEFVESKSKPEAYMTYPPSEDPARMPLVIDNGSYQFRAGWGSNSNPLLVFKNILARNRYIFVGFLHFKLILNHKEID